jgi:hypothetical protein
LEEYLIRCTDGSVIERVIFPDDDATDDSTMVLHSRLVSVEDQSHLTKLDRHVRVPSTHCAINCNAQFKPHVDSGRGLGQSLSMIVGLGDYVGGEITIEFVPYPIRYQPVEFDGWKLRHWTKPFVGSDRFTLVWFTPAT